MRKQSLVTKKQTFRGGFRLLGDGVGKGRSWESASWLPNGLGGVGRTISSGLGNIGTQLSFAVGTPSAVANGALAGLKTAFTDPRVAASNTWAKAMENPVETAAIIATVGALGLGVSYWRGAGARAQKAGRSAQAQAG